MRSEQFELYLLLLQKSKSVQSKLRTYETKIEQDHLLMKDHSEAIRRPPSKQGAS